MSTPIRLVACDLDGTLVTPDLRLAPGAVAAFAKLAARGVHVAVATGRMVASATPYARQLGVEAPIITYNGAWIRCLKTERDLWHRAVAAETVSEAVSALEDAGLHVNVYLGDRVHVRSRSAEAEAYLAHARVEAVWCDAWADLGVISPTKILAIGPESRVRAVIDELRPRFAGRLWLTQSMPTFLEVAHPTVNKGVALAHLAEHLGVPREAVVAVGDGLNDLEMLKWAGVGVAMGNGHPELKRQADRVTGRVEDDGVARLIEDLIAEGRC